MRNHHPPTPIRAAKLPAQPADGLLLVLAQRLFAAGLDTRSPAWEDRGYLKIINTPGALTELTVTTCGQFAWEYRPSHPTPARLTAIVLTLLDPAARPNTAAESRIDLTLLIRVGRALASHGLSTSLDILDISQATYDIYSELRVTNPARPERGAVSLADDGTIWWECRTQPDLSLDGIAATIIQALTAASPD